MTQTPRPLFWLDSYERRARLIPGLIAVLPIAVMVVSLGIREKPAIVGISSLLTATGLPVLLSSTVRIWGIKMQTRLFDEWGGAPTNQLLRFRGEPSQEHQRAQYRANVIAFVGHGLPTSADEDRDPVGADDRYEAAVKQVRISTSDRSKYPLVFVESRNFGFERNLLGAKVFGQWVAAVSALTLFVLLVLATATSLVKIGALGPSIGLIVCLALLGVWRFLPSSERARLVGFRYAERLLGSTPELVARPPGPTTR